MTDPCTWTQDDPDYDAWDTACGHLFVLNEGTPTHNRMAFCCFCGAALHEVPYVAPVEDDDE